MNTEPQIDHAKLIRLNAQYNQLSRATRSIGEELREATPALRHLESEWAARVGMTDDDGTAIADPLSTLNWPGELKRHAGIASQQAQQLVTLREQVAELRRNQTAASQRAQAFGAWFSRVKSYARNHGVEL